LGEVCTELIFPDGRVLRGRARDDAEKEFISGCPVDYVLHTIVGREYDFGGKVYNRHIHSVDGAGENSTRLASMRTTDPLMEAHTGVNINDLRAQRHALR
jgi:hypothetical protein